MAHTHLKTGTSLLFPTEFREIFERIRRISGDLSSGIDDSETVTWKAGWDATSTKIGGLLSKTHFLVGLLGGSQVGKSTTVNNLLGFELVPKGDGTQSTSSVRIRLKRSKDDQFWVRTHYLSKDAFCDWCAKIAEKLGCAVPSNIGFSLDDAVEELDALPNDQNRNQDLVTYYRRLLMSGKKFGNDLFGRSLVDDLSNLKDVQDLLTRIAKHPQSANASEPAQSTLLSEIAVDLPLEFLHPNLELIDLPGFRTTQSQDEEHTASFMVQLDGTFFVTSVDDKYKSSKDLDELYKKMLRRDPDFPDRMWLVLNKWGKLNHDALEVNGENSRFRTICETAEKFQADLNRIVMVENEYFDLLKESDDKSFTRAQSFKFWKKGTAPADYVPKNLADHQRTPLLQAFEQMMDHGGIDELRRRISQELYPRIQQKKTSELRSAISNAIEQLQKRIKWLRQEFDFGSSDERTLWRKSIIDLGEAVKGNRNGSVGAESELSNAIWQECFQHYQLLSKRISNAASNLNVQSSPAEVEENYSECINDWEETSTNYFLGDEMALDRISDKVIHCFLEVAKQNEVESVKSIDSDQPDLLPRESPIRKFRSIAESKDAQLITKIREVLGSYRSLNISEIRKHEGVELSALDYKKIMRRKCHRVGIEIQRCISDHLITCISELRAVIANLNAQEHGKGANNQRLDEWNDELKKLSANLADANLDGPTVSASPSSKGVVELRSGLEDSPESNEGLAVSEEPAATGDLPAEDDELYGFGE